MLNFFARQLSFYLHLYAIHTLTFRSMGALLTALIISMMIGPSLIRFLKYQQKRINNVREDVPETHMKKIGTPSMGGMLILFSFFISVFLWNDLSNIHLLIILGTAFGFGAIGFYDDILKIKRKKGLSGKSKIILQLLLAFCILFYFNAHLQSLDKTYIVVPFAKSLMIDLGWMFVPFSVLVVVGSSNAVNLTDGLDGLAIVPVMVCIAGFAIFSYVTGNSIYSRYLLIPFIPGSGEITVMCSAIIGAGLGFLWFNAPPAMVFMGDTGSLALGASLGMISVILKQELILVIMGGLFVLEAISVMVQVVSFQLTGKRVFSMAPIHHHLEKKGLAESTIVIRFWIIATVLLLISLSSLKIR